MWKAIKKMSSESCEAIWNPEETEGPGLPPKTDEGPGLPDQLWDFEEIKAATGLPDCLIDLIVAFGSRCKDFYTCGSHLSTEDVDADFTYCKSCTKVCIMPNCRKTFTPDNEGSGYTEGMCGECSMCRFCKLVQWDYVCGCEHACWQSGLVEEPPEQRV